MISTSTATSECMAFADKETDPRVRTALVNSCMARDEKRQTMLYTAAITSAVWIALIVGYRMLKK